MSIIEFRNIYKTYDGETNVIDDLSLDIGQGEFVTILGPSGCGKTTLLKMVNKLHNPTAGEIILKDENLDNWDTIDLRRSVGYVIQQIGLFPHLTILDNIAFVLDLKDKDKQFKQKRAGELIELVGLDKSYLSRYPRELSGGQKQRVGVARALAADPDIILMDEPFGAVDEIARARLQEKFREIQRKLNKTVLFVTHDIDEALKLGTKTIIMNNGKIEQAGTAEELVYQPKTEFVREFLGLKGFKAILDPEVFEKMYTEKTENYQDVH